MAGMAVDCAKEAGQVAGAAAALEAALAAVEQNILVKKTIV